MQKYMKIWDVHARNPPCSLLSRGILNIKSTGWTVPIRIFSFWIQDFPDCDSISNDTRKIEFLDYADPVYELLIEMEKDLFSQDCLEYNFSLSKTNWLVSTSLSRGSSRRTATLFQKVFTTTPILYCIYYILRFLDYPEIHALHSVLHSLSRNCPFVTISVFYCELVIPPFMWQRCYWFSQVTLICVSNATLNSNVSQIQCSSFSLS